ncbi:extended synaptotagmin-1 isoform X1 [Xenopus laevis]|uniref:Extended synaptotagmin-1 isoform X1 n=2 Tax=Xenopus laevis TaxID=8355 RepID=A0A8J1M9Q4_XENLA|nr:extended synaptotagmin-1 isoform X1 [Xenopus laevis]
MSDTETLPVPTSGSELVPHLLSMGKKLLLLLPIYLCGYFGMSIFFVIAGLFLYLGWKGSRENKLSRLKSAQEALEKEVAVTASTMFMNKSELPSWVSFPDTEKAEFLNKMVAQMWPFIGQYLEKLLTDSIAPTIRASNPHLSTFYFTKINLGEKAPKVTGVKVHTEFDKKQIILDLHLSYVGDIEVNVEVKKYFCKAGIKGMQLHGMLRVILEPLIGDVPIIGAITLFFIRRPVLDINWTGLTNLLDIPGLNVMSDTMVMDIISGFLVLPNRLAIPLTSNLHVAELRSPLPRGIVRIHLLEARDLSAKDLQLKGLFAGKSDPYAIVRVGTQVFNSQVINENLNPVWNEMYEVIVHEVPGQELEVELFDKDPDQDDFLGRMKLDLGEVKQHGSLDKWFTLSDTKSGKLHLRLEWLTLMSNASQLKKILEINQAITAKTQEEPSAAILIVYLDRAQDLPLKKNVKEPSPMVLLSIQDVKKESKTVPSSSSPVWEEPFRFFLRDPNIQDLNIEVKDDDRQHSLGSLSVPLSRLLSADNLTLDQWFQLENSGSRSRIYMKLVMRILYLDPVSTLMTADPESIIADEAGSSVDNPPRPSHTTIPEKFATENLLRIFILEAENLIAKDNLMGGLVKGKSDPYTVISSGGKKVRTRVVDNNLNPCWNQAFEILVTDVPGQDIVFEVFDKDVDKDDFLGSCKISVKDAVKQKFINEWLPLEKVKSGKLHVKLECLSLVADSSQIDQVLMMNSLFQPAHSDNFSAAILYVFIERASGLQMRKGDKNPSPSAELKLRNDVYKTKVSQNTNTPVWEESFVLLLKTPHSEELELMIRDEGKGSLGSLTIPVLDLLNKEDLTMDGWFPLSTSGANSEVLIRLQMRVLVSPSPPKESEVDPCQPTVEDSSLNKQFTEGELRQRQQLANSDMEPSASQFGQLCLKLYYPAKDGRLVAVVSKCRNLSTSAKEPPDPYLSFLLLPDKSRSTKRKTSVKKRTHNPEYNEKIEWEMSLEEARKRKLEISVKNSVSFMSREKELLGKVLIDLSDADLATGQNGWYDVEPEITSA